MVMDQTSVLVPHLLKIYFGLGWPSSVTKVKNKLDIFKLCITRLYLLYRNLNQEMNASQYSSFYMLIFVNYTNLLIRTIFNNIQQYSSIFNLNGHKRNLQNTNILKAYDASQQKNVFISTRSPLPISFFWGFCLKLYHAHIRVVELSLTLLLLCQNNPTKRVTSCLVFLVSSLLSWTAQQQVYCVVKSADHEYTPDIQGYIFTRGIKELKMVLKINYDQKTIRILSILFLCNM